MRVCLLFLPFFLLSLLFHLLSDSMGEDDETAAPRKRHHLKKPLSAKKKKKKSGKGEDQGSETEDEEFEYEQQPPHARLCGPDRSQCLFCTH